MARRPAARKRVTPVNGPERAGAKIARPSGRRALASARRPAARGEAAWTPMQEKTRRASAQAPSAPVAHRMRSTARSGAKRPSAVQAVQRSKRRRVTVSRQNPVAFLRRQWLQYAVSGEVPQTKADKRTATLVNLGGVAVAALVLYRLAPATVPGGFFGSTLLLVIAGFAVTRGIELALGQHEGFSYGRYALGIVKRLLPPALVLVAVAVLATMALRPGLVEAALAGAPAAALFFANWPLSLAGGAFDAPAVLAAPLAHMWLPALIAQLALVWPPILMVLARKLRKRWHAVCCAGALALAATLALALATLLTGSTALGYFGTLTRAAEFLVGAGAALALPLLGSPRAHRAQQGGEPSPADLARRFLGNALLSPDATTAASLLCLLVLGIAALFAGGTGAWFGGFLVAAVICAGLAVSLQQPENGMARMLRSPACSYLGSRALSLYLVHYPLIALMNGGGAAAGTWWQALLQLAAMLIAAEVFYRLVEAPFKTLGDNLAKLAASRARR